MSRGHPPKVAMCWGSEPPAFSIGYEREKVFANDSGFVVIFDDAPEPEDVEPGDPRIEWVCLHCLINDHPEIGRGLDLAGEHGAADLIEGEWVARTPESEDA